MISVPCYEVSFLTLCAEASGLQPRTQLGNLHCLKRRHSMARLEVPFSCVTSDDRCTPNFIEPNGRAHNKKASLFGRSGRHFFNVTNKPEGRFDR
jgi:hypothetical protein